MSNGSKGFVPQPGTSTGICPAPKRIYERNSPLTETNQHGMLTDDADGHLCFNIGDTLNNYTLLDVLGKGTFGRVALARNRETYQVIALKIARSTPSCKALARIEISNLKILKKIDPQGKNLWVKMVESFEFKSHVCIAFERLGENLYEYMKRNEFRPYQLKEIRHIGYQICHSVKALHENKIIHADLKPENICLVYGDRRTRQQTYRMPVSTNIRLIDFGSSFMFAEEVRGCRQTRPYRAPEVIFDLIWTKNIDIWSIGCILFEMYCSEYLFFAENDDEHYQVLEEVLGPIPELYRRTELAKSHNKKACPPRQECVRRRPLKKYMKKAAVEHQELFDLIEKMLKYVPEERVTLSAALDHPFFQSLPDV